MSEIQQSDGNIVQIDLTQTPNEVPQVEAGQYKFEIISCELKPNKAGDGWNIVARQKVVTEGPMYGREITDFMSVNQTDPNKNVRIRHFTLCALGTVPVPLALNAFPGKIVEAVVTQTPDKQDSTKLYSNIKDYIVPKDVLDANPVKK